MAKANNYIKSIFNKISSSSKSFYQRRKLFLKKYKFQIVLSLLVAVSIFVLYHYLWRISFNDFYNDIDNSKKSLYIRNIAIALAAIATAVFTWWKNSLNNKTNEISQKKTEIEESTRQDSLFAQAVSFLNENNDLTTRKAGVHILKDLAMTSPKHAQKCIDMLCSLNESWMPKFLKKYPNFFLYNYNLATTKDLEELLLDRDKYVFKTLETQKYLDKIVISQLVLISMSEIIQYINSNSEYKGPFNLRHKYLCHIDLSYMVLDKRKFSFSNIHLQGANLKMSNLQNSDLSEAILQNADLWKTDFTDAELYHTDFRNAHNTSWAIFNNNQTMAIFSNEDYKRYYP